MTTNNSPCDLLAARFEKKAADGLLDVKFLLQANEATAEDICHEVERLYVAMDDQGKFKPLDFGDRNWDETPKAR
jgi:hypothetical protein